MARLIWTRQVLLLLSLTTAVAASATAESEPTAMPFTTRHTSVINQQSVQYTATVSETILRNEEGQPVLRLVTTAYVRETPDASQRPVLFVFNGGPSASSATLHMWALGPKRIAVAQDPREDPAPRLVDNASTVLDATDLVFIDPAETGFSRVLAAGKREDFYSVDGDARSIAHFVEAWVKANHREHSPKYVLGESYGTIRATLMAGMLASTMPLDGVVLFGQAVNIIETSQRAKNAVGYATNLPALAAIAAYHGRASRHGKSMDTFVNDTYHWAIHDYLPALIAGRDLPISAQRRIARQLQSLTGISANYYLSHELIISKIAFARELLKDQNLILAQYDARYTGPAPAAGERAVNPFAKITQATVPWLRSHLSESLAVTLPMSDYREVAPQTDGWRWSPTSGIGGPFWDYNYQAELSKAFAANSRFRLMIGTGIYDLTTTVGPARYLVAQSDYPADRVYLRQYEGGHMAYTNELALAAFTADIRTLVKGGALPR